MSVHGIQNWSGNMTFKTVEIGCRYMFKGYLNP